jgi:signal transduction histidine kinase
MVMAIAVVLTLSLRSLSREKTRLLRGFANAQENTAKELASDLEDRLRAIEEDARVIATLVRAAGDALPSDRAEAERTMLSSFRAMATVVRHYRSLALLGSDLHLRMSAVDPSEDAETAAALMDISRHAAARSEPPHLTGPVDVKAKRNFYAYRFPAGASTVVITIDAPRLLQSALRSVPDSRVIVSDPGGAEWTGCGASTPCVRRPAAAGGEPPAEQAGSVWLEDWQSERLGLPRQTAVSAWMTTVSPGTGVWRVQLVASAGAIHAREQALARQLLLTAIGLLAAIGIVGALIVRQQRYSAVLAERLRGAEALQALERQLIRAEKLATTGALSAGIAHEVGTPLGIIRARAEILMDELAGHPAKKALVAIVVQIDRISSIIRQVLDFSRTQAVEVRPVAANMAVRATLELLEHRFAQQHLAVHVNIPGDLPPMAADSNQLQQVLINVLLNACDACGKGGAIRISAQLDQHRRRIEWRIRDDGEGIVPENLLSVFDPFFTTKKRGEGTGLGLPVAASIVRNHGGDISLASVPGAGTTVTILWPIATESRHAET